MCSLSQKKSLFFPPSFSATNFSHLHHQNFYQLRPPSIPPEFKEKEKTKEKRREEEKRRKRLFLYVDSVPGFLRTLAFDWGTKP